MKIIIVGAGIVGYSLAEYFSREKHQITLIDQNEAFCEAIKNKLDVIVVPGHGCAPQVLEDAGIETADMLIAVTPSDETNLLACHFAMQKKVQKRIARLKSDIYTHSAAVDLMQLGVTNIVEPEREVVKKIIQYVDLNGVTETGNFQADTIFLRGYMITDDMPIVHKTLREVNAMAEGSPLLVVAITRAGKSVQPTGDEKLCPGDEIIAIMPKDSYKMFRTLINRRVTKCKKIIVSGDSLTAIHLADELRAYCDRVVLVDPDRDHGALASSMLNGVEVFHGDCTDSDILQEMNVSFADYFIAVGNDSEDNIMSCLLAKTSGAPMTIAVRNDDRYQALFHSLGIDHVINTYDITLKMIIEKIQTVSIATYLKLRTTDSEVVRLKIRKKSSIVNKSLSELDRFFKKAVVVGCIIREDEVIIPWGGTVLRENDEVIIISRREQLDRIQKEL